jgi:hypothetical protein
MSSTETTRPQLAVQVTIRRCPLCRGLIVQAARLAERLQSEMGVDASIARGRWGEFTVLVGDRPVVRQRWYRPWKDDAVIDAVRQGLSDAVAGTQDLAPLRVPR